MWIIKKQDTDETFTLISEKNNYTVGRTSADLVLSHDNSISRSHSILRIIVSDKETLALEDIGSKYGTFINENIENSVKLNQGEQQELSDGDRVRFGVFKNIWHVSHAPIISAISGLSSGDAKILEHYMSILGGKLVDKWDMKCTHLTMKEFRLTVKALHALVEQRPIVTLDYWRNFVDAARRGRSTLPQPNEYKPINSNDLMGHNLDCTITPARKTVFSGMTFVFMNANQLELYGPIIIKAGGATRDLKSGVQKSFLLKSNVVVLQYVPSTQSQDYLETNNLRFIPEYEIGLAIVHCSTEKFCNPSYKVINGLIPSTSSMGLSPNTCLVKNTEATQSNASERTELFLLETEKIGVNDDGKSGSKQNPILDDESMSPIRVTESAEENMHSKRKRNKINQIVSDDSDDSNEEENLFQLKKRMQTMDKVTGKKSPIKNVISKPKPKPLPIITTRKEKTTVEGFQQKSGVQVDNSPPRSSNTAHLETQQPYKRPIIAVLTDNDDSDDDLFNFGGGPLKKICLQDKGFGEELYDVRNKHNDRVDHAPVAVPTTEQLKKPVFVLPKPKPLPQKVSITGWLSCGKTIKDEELDMKNENSTDEKHQFIESFKNAFIVQVKKLIISKPLEDLSSLQLTLNNSKNNGTPNFKKFVKTKNLRPQQRIVPTHPVSLRSLLLNQS
ncbi:nibrin-like isoform X2 [Teleopsis dalmanni]|uniref:nibrin-like isoform X2 n=1 Tax=Teleopsis dalmanni TaxID=139649 RepID=UPI0018CCB849|nr:nibrin-like isoform X2 [Teleopsis dalmanni]